jgi:cobalt-zinc-cadmium efflux system membrane fusion protein
MKNHWLKNLAYITMFSVLVSCTSKNESSEKVQKNLEEIVSLTPEQASNAGIVLDSLRSIAIDEEVAANGIVEVPPQHLASVSVPMAGYVNKSEVLTGQHVHKGDVLADLHHPSYIDLQQELAKETNKLSFAEEEYSRQKEMLSGYVTAKREFQQAETSYKSQKATVKALEEKVKLLGLFAEKVKQGEIYSHIQLRSPIDGYVKSSAASIGKFATPEMVLFEIIDISHMHIELKVFEQDISKVVKGQKVVFYQPNAETRKMEGEIWLVGKNLDLTNRTVGVHVHFDEENAKGLLPGMYVSARIEANKRTVLAIPEKAVVGNGKSYFVFCLKNESRGTKYFDKVPIELGIRMNGWIEIKNTSALLSKKIVTDGAYYLNAEMMKE